MSKTQSGFMPTREHGSVSSASGDVSIVDKVEVQQLEIAGEPRHHGLEAPAQLT